MGALPLAPQRRIMEVKEKLDGTVLRFDLECWLQTPDLMVGRWVAEAGNPVGAPPGTTSWGVWWRSRPCGAYRLHEPDGALRAYRLDALERVRIGVDEVRYRDLLLDAWIDRDGVARVEDEEEVAAAVAAGTMTSHQHRRVRCMREIILRRPEAIVARVDEAVEAAIAAVRAGGGQAADSGGTR